MKKRILAILLALSMILVFTACGAETSSQRPDGWDVEAEVLRYCNGFYRAKTAQELKPYVLSKTSNGRIKEYMDASNTAFQEMMEGELDYRDYPYDSVEVTLLDTYKGYEILWVKTTSTAFQQAADALTGDGSAPVVYSGISPNLLMALTIENGHYVSSLDESLSKEVFEKYDYCQSCHGQGGIDTMGIACGECFGAGSLTEYTCNDCGEVFSNTPLFPDVQLGDWVASAVKPQEAVGEGSFVEVQEGTQISVDSDLTVMVLGSTCTACGGTNVSTVEKTCEICQGSGGMDDTFESCTSCDGKGWIKK